ncbi:MAG: 2-dehydropantoate 2-reductase, partial [Deltaproteobacteria bacterium]
MVATGRQYGPRILVVGCGAIGGTVAARLIHQGLDVTALTHNELITDAINASGFRTRGELSLGDIAGHGSTALPKNAKPIDGVLLATQPPQVEQAAQQLLPVLAEDGDMVCFQNGLCEQRIAAIVGLERVIGAVVAWGASMPEPGLYDRTSAGGFVLGRLDGTLDDRVRTTAHLLEAIGPVTLTDNLPGVRWSKLAINCAITSLGAIGGDRLGVLLRKRYVRRLALEIMTEAVDIAFAERITLEKVAGTLDLEWLALSESDRKSKLGSTSLLAKHALLLAVGTRYRRLRSSMLTAIERGREPAVDFLNGEVVVRGSEHSIVTPINTAVLVDVRRIAAGEIKPGEATLEALFQRTREAPSHREG